MKHINKNISANESSSLTSCFLAIASRKLNKKEKQTLALLNSIEEKKSATQTAKALAQELQCAESTVWATLRSLRSLGLVTVDQENEVLALSRSARLIVREFNP
ncbi:MAG: HTH domain-containing protein [Nanoarchaeota archaeon]